MKRIYFGIIVLGIICIAPAVWGYSMCMHARTYIAILSKSTDGLNSEYDASAKSWTVTFGYKTSTRDTTTVSGVAACIDVTGTAYTADSTISASVTDVGENCWCSMLLPLASDWVYYGQTTASVCAAECAANCANAVKSEERMRTALYESVW